MSDTLQRVLVTGGTGFIGAALTRALVNAGHDVHVASREPSRAGRLAGLEGRYVAHRADLADPAAVRNVVHESRPEVVYHLAAAGASGRADPADLIRANVRGTANLLDALGSRSFRALVHVGSGAEYGPCPDPIPEDAPLRPQTEYARAKAEASRLCLTRAVEGWPVTVVRVFGAYGPGETQGRLLPYVLNSCRRGDVIRVSAGVQRRDWVYVEDVVEVLLAATTPAARGRVLHAASGREHTVREAVELAVAVTGTPTPVVYGSEPPRPGEPERYLAAIETTRRLTGWEPRVPLPEGIRRTWEWVSAREERGAA